jgi:PKD repeat protein
MKIKSCIFSLIIVLFIINPQTSQPVIASGAVNCSFTETGKISLPDLGPNMYCRDGNCFQGGLYPGGLSTKPPDLDLEAQNVAGQIESLDVKGNIDAANGKIVMISVGMSNSSMAFEDPSPNPPWTAFVPRAKSDPAKNPQLVLINGALGGEAADAWEDPNALGWKGIKDKIESYNKSNKSASSISPEQVQVAWVKQALRYTGPFPDYAQELQGYLEAIARNLKFHFPNIKIAYYTSRSYAYSEFRKGEPDTYEGGFAIRWMIEKQMKGDPNLNYDPKKGVAKAPLVLWGPYYWTDGLNPRSDGLIWTCGEGGDQYNGIHPEPNGAQKNADQLFAFFKTDPTTIPWYLKKTPSGQAPAVTVTAHPLAGSAPLTVSFSASATGQDAQIIEYVWTFGDGTFSYHPNGSLNSPPYYSNPNPTKTFYNPGTYDAFLTVTDTKGNTSTEKIRVTVTGSGGGSEPGQPEHQQFLPIITAGETAIPITADPGGARSIRINPGTSIGTNQNSQSDLDVTLESSVTIPNLGEPPPSSVKGGKIDEGEIAGKYLISAAKRSESRESMLWMTLLIPVVSVTFFFMVSRYVYRPKRD